MINMPFRQMETLRLREAVSDLSGPHTASAAGIELGPDLLILSAGTIPPLGLAMKLGKNKLGRF